MHIHILANINIPQAVINSPAADPIVLTREAVYLALQELPSMLQGRRIFILSEDWHARGGSNFVLQNNFTLVTYLEFTKLCSNCMKIITW